MKCLNDKKPKVFRLTTPRKNKCILVFEIIHFRKSNKEVVWKADLLIRHKNHFSGKMIKKHFHEESK